MRYALHMMKSIAFMSCLAASIGTAPFAKPWEDVIPTVADRAALLLLEAEQRGYSDIAKRVGEGVWYEFYQPDHECAILGRMLGVPELIADEEKIDIPEFSDFTVEISDIDVIRLYAGGRTLETWVEQASELVDRDLSEKVAFWNGQCAIWDRIRNAPKFTVSAGPGYEAFPSAGSLSEDETPVMPVFDGRDAWARSFRTRIRDGLAAGPNFAGHYTIIMFGCGASCRGYFLADAKNGQVFSLPFGGEASPETSIDFRDDSRLIYARQVGDTFEECALRAFEFDGAAFTEIHKEQWPREGTCSIGWFQVITE